MAEFCKRHPETELVIVAFCPVCRGQHGGEIAAQSMTAEAKSARARKAARTRWAKKRKSGGKK